MTREEAANVLRSTWLNAGRVNGKTVFAEALNMAIKALETQPDGDTVSRRAALDEIDSFLAVDKYYHPYSQGKTIPVEEMRERLKQLPSAQPESTRTFVELVVRYPDPELCTYKEYKGKPYYSIKYIENGETYVGYGTYNPEVLSQYLKEYFISSAQPEIIRCQDCKHRLSSLYCEAWNNSPGFPCIGDEMFCSMAERRTDEQTD